MQTNRPSGSDYRRAAFHGVRTLGDLELLAQLLSGSDSRRQRIAETLLARAGSTWALAQWSLHTLTSNGLSRSEALRLHVGLELGRRAVAQPVPSKAIHAPEDAYRCVAAELTGATCERFVVVVLDIKNRPRHVRVVAEGSIDQCPVDPREVFATALQHRGSSVLVAHNHPSGDPAPSPEDLRLTDRLLESGELLGIPVLDHIVVGQHHGDDTKPYVSLAECGLMPSRVTQRAA